MSLFIVYDQHRPSSSLVLLQWFRETKQVSSLVRIPAKLFSKLDTSSVWSICSIHCEFIKSCQCIVCVGFANDSELYHMEMKSLLKTLPKPNYDTLKYTASLLVLVAKNESKNKMNPLSLGIVFGPNIFRYCEIRVTCCHCILIRIYLLTLHCKDLHLSRVMNYIKR